MWVRMSITGCFATRAACWRAVPIQRGGLIAQPDSDVWGRVQALQTSCKSRETERVCMSRRGIYSSFLCVNGSFWNSELEFTHGEGGKKKSLGKVFPGAVVFRSSQVGKVSAGSHQSDFLMWVLDFVVCVASRRQKEWITRLWYSSKGNCGHVCSRLCQRRRCRWTAAAALGKQGWSRSLEGWLRSWEPAGEGAARFPSLFHKGCYSSPKEGLGCMDRADDGLGKQLHWQEFLTAALCTKGIVICFLRLSKWL